MNHIKLLIKNILSEDMDAAKECVHDIVMDKFELIGSSGTQPFVSLCEETKVWTKEEIRKNIEDSDKWLYKGLLAIYKYQTEDEIHSKTTNQMNSVGFSSFDAKPLSSAAEWVKSKGFLPEKTKYGNWKAKVRAKMLKYSGQLAKIANNAPKEGGQSSTKPTSSGEEHFIVYENKHGYEGWTVKKIAGKYPRSSVLAGQDRIVFVDSFDSREEAEKAYPNAQVTSEFTGAPRNYTDHLPGDDDSDPYGDNKAAHDEHRFG